MSNRYDSYPILVARAIAPSPTFNTIAELDVVTLPELGVNEADASIQNSAIDRWVTSTLLRRKPVPLKMNFDPADGTQDHITGLYKALATQSLDAYKWSHSASGLVWIASGNVTNIKPDTPMEGKISLNVTMRFSGAMSINGVQLGT